VLLATGRPCGEIAFEVGFFDQSHLNRWFRRVYGISPGEYQRTLLGPVTSSRSRPIARQASCPR
jgi:AraC-like DNA-binding protein